MATPHVSPPRLSSPRSSAVVRFSPKPLVALSPPFSPSSSDSRGLNLAVALTSPAVPPPVPQRTHPMILRRMTSKSTAMLTASSLATNDDVELSCFTIANKFPVWRQAMLEEINALVRNGTWSLHPQHHV